MKFPGKAASNIFAGQGAVKPAPTVLSSGSETLANTEALFSMESEHLTGRPLSRLGADFTSVGPSGKTASGGEFDKETGKIKVTMNPGEETRAGIIAHEFGHKGLQILGKRIGEKSPDEEVQFRGKKVNAAKLLREISGSIWNEGAIRFGDLKSRNKKIRSEAELWFSEGEKQTNLKAGELRRVSGQINGVLNSLARKFSTDKDFSKKTILTRGAK